MRKSTLIAASVAGISALYAANSIAISNQPQPIVLVQPVSEDQAESSSASAASNNPTEPVTEPTQEIAEPAPTETVAPDQTAPAEAQVAEQAPEPAPASPEPAPEPQTKTVASDEITYQYGVIQLELTSTGGSLTDVRVLQGDMTYGRDAAYAALIDASIAAQGSNIGNYSGATFTTEAFKKAIDSGLGKL